MNHIYHRRVQRNTQTFTLINQNKPSRSAYIYTYIHFGGVFSSAIIIWKTKYFTHFYHCFHFCAVGVLFSCLFQLGASFLNVCIFFPLQYQLWHTEGSSFVIWLLCLVPCCYCCWCFAWMSFIPDRCHIFHNLKIKQKILRTREKSV